MYMLLATIALSAPGVHGMMAEQQQGPPRSSGYGQGNAVTNTAAESAGETWTPAPAEPGQDESAESYQPTPNDDDPPNEPTPASYAHSEQFDSTDAANDASAPPTAAYPGPAMPLEGARSFRPTDNDVFTAAARAAGAAQPSAVGPLAAEVAERRDAHDDALHTISRGNVARGDGTGSGQVRIQGRLDPISRLAISADYHDSEDDTDYRPEVVEEEEGSADSMFADETPEAFLARTANLGDYESPSTWMANRRRAQDELERRRQHVRHQRERERLRRRPTDHVSTTMTGRLTLTNFHGAADILVRNESGHIDPAQLSSEPSTISAVSSAADDSQPLDESAAATPPEAEAASAPSIVAGVLNRAARPAAGAETDAVTPTPAAQAATGPPPQRNPAQLFAQVLGLPSDWAQFNRREVNFCCSTNTPIGAKFEGSRVVRTRDGIVHKSQLTVSVEIEGPVRYNVNFQNSDLTSRAQVPAASTTSEVPPPSIAEQLSGLGGGRGASGGPRAAASRTHSVGRGVGAGAPTQTMLGHLGTQLLGTILTQANVTTEVQPIVFPTGTVDNCAICRDTMVPAPGQTSNDSVALSCGHMFHERCIARQIEAASHGNNRCPICREQFDIREENWRRIRRTNDAASGSNAQ